MADWEALKHKRLYLVKKNLERANKSRVRHHDYKVGDKVLKLIYKPHKMQPRATGPYKVTRVHVNGTLTIQLTPLITERLNIRRLKPYWEKNT